MSGLLLDDAALYLAEINRLALRRERDRWLPWDELNARNLLSRAPEVAARLAREIPERGHTFVPLLPRQALISQKQRTLYQIDALDAVVWSASARVIGAAIDDQLGDQLYSYRPGRSHWSAAEALLAFWRRHAAERPDPRERGLYVLRRDVCRYGESIPNHDESSLWPSLQGLLSERRLGLRCGTDRFLKSLLRPEVRQTDGSAAPMPVGIPNGIPSQVIACNVYLLPADRAAQSIQDGFYARYGDDILYAHADHERFRTGRDALEEAVAKLGLAFSPAKSRELWLTEPGRAHPTHPEYGATRMVDYLGVDIACTGVRLRRDKRRQFWLELRTRLNTTSSMLADLPFDARARALCAVVSATLDPACPLAQRYASWLGTRAMDGGDLRALDHSIALHVATLLTGQRGVRAFRHAPARLLRTTYGLPSLRANQALGRRRGRRA